MYGTNQRQKSKHDRWSAFELDLKSLLYKMNDPIVIDNYLLVDDIKHAIIVIMSKDFFDETDEILISNTLHDYYEAMDKLESSHPEIKDCLSCIRTFMDDFYLKSNETGDANYYESWSKK